MSWSVAIGGTDVTYAVQQGSSFTEIASSSQGQGTLTLAGSHPEAVAGASVILTANGSTGWEGTISAVTPQVDTQGNTVASRIIAAPLAAQFAVHVPSGNTVSNDVGDIVANLVSGTSIGFNPVLMGMEVGALHFGNIDSALTTLAVLAGSSWRVENGYLVFVNPAVSGFTEIPVALNGVPNSYESITVLGGLDSVSRQPLSQMVPTIGSPEGLNGYVSYPEISDSGTLNVAAGNLAGWYGNGAIFGTVQLSGVCVRAGDWLQDINQVTAVSSRVVYSLVAGDMWATIQFGFPALSVVPIQNALLQNSQYPSARVSGDYVVQGLAATPSLLTVALAAGVICLAGASYALSGQSVSVPNDSVLNLLATSSGVITGDPFSVPQPGQAISLYQVTTWNNAVQGVIPLTTFGGVGNNNLKAANPANDPGITSPTVTLVAEGAASAKATITFSISGLTLDDTIGSIEAGLAHAGTGQFGNWHTLAWTPSSTSLTDYEHNLSGGQNYDVGINVLGRNGIPLNASPLIIGASPTISGAAISQVLAANSVAWKQLLGDTSGDTTTSIADTGNKRFLHTGMSTAVQDTLNASADAFGTYTQYGVLHRLHIDQQTTFAPGGTNLLYNSTFSAGFAGWSYGQFGANTATWSTDTYGGGRLIASVSSSTANINDLYGSLSIPITNSLPMVVSGILHVAGTLPSGASMGVDILDQSSNVLGSYFLGAQTTTSYFPFAVSITPGGSVTSIGVRCRLIIGSNAASSLSCAWSKLQVEYGNRPTTWVDHYSALNANSLMDGSSNIRATTPFNTNTPNMIPFTTNTIAEFSSPSGQTYIIAYVDNGTAGTGPTFYYPNGTTATAVALSGTSVQTVNVSSFPTYYTNGTQGVKFTGLSGSATYYFIYFYSFKTSEWTIGINSSQFTAAQIANAFEDGVLASLTTSGTNSWTAGGGGGGHGGCPEINEPIECRRDGNTVTIPAGSLCVGDKLRDFEDGVWNEITAFSVGPAIGWEVKFAGKQPCKVDASHLFVKPDGSWVNVRELKRGDVVAGKRDLTVEYVMEIGRIRMAHITCERSRYLFNEAGCHNIKVQ